MSHPTLSKEEMIAAIQECARRLGRTPAVAEVVRTVQGITRYGIIRRFGSYTKALRACGLETPGSGRVAEMGALFLEWAGLARRLGHVPTITDYDRQSRYSVRPLLNRFANWRSVPLG